MEHCVSRDYINRTITRSIDMLQELVELQASPRSSSQISAALPLHLLCPPPRPEDETLLCIALFPAQVHRLSELFYSAFVPWSNVPFFLTHPNRSHPLSTVDNSALGNRKSFPSQALCGAGSLRQWRTETAGCVLYFLREGSDGVSHRVLGCV